MTNPLLSLRHVETWYGRIQALRGISLEVPEGSITAILGGNGAGKTTILNTIAGVLDDQPEKGTIVFAGERIDRAATESIIRSGIGYVPEGRQLFPELTVAENLAVGAWLRRDRDALAADLEWVRDTFPPLRERERQLAGTLSGGEQQMLAIGRAVMTRPRLLLMDEPSLGLSPIFVSRMFEAIVKIRERSVTILLVEQNARKALEIADHGNVIEDGRIVAGGTSAELLRNDDVREFYLGMRSDQFTGGAQRWKRKKRWR
ncbi:MAG TPA: ABC transporter ATP-binding protein [Thermoanaerobaculia bacterium]|nr:ABC transporter ATP-binding protein [Thermoanaerobaculia bacterium]